ncbi:calcium-binding protein [Hansschlegelia sp. KR7-227]|uniref:calcium-binding protein n=1 Tax=Hansschlegelia sp. KR7-227 TaxID=3400914 RepID=UPI003C0E198E
MADKYGTNAPDVLAGTDDADRIYGWDQTNAPNNLGPATDGDVINAGGNADNVYGGGGNDVLNGEAGDDRLFGGTQNDTIYGGAVNDVAGLDTLNGGAGDDLLIEYGGVRSELNGSDGDDVMIIAPGMAGVVAGGEGRDSLELYDNGAFPFGLGTLRIVGVEAFYTNDRLVEGTAAQWESFDTIAVSKGNLAGGVLIGLTGGGGLNLSDELGGRNTNIYGSDLVDRITGGEGEDRIIGYAGNDVFYGGGGKDLLEGYGDNDKLFGEAGDDVLNGFDGRDRLSGGSGIDSMLGGSGDDTIDGGGVEGSDGFDPATDIETIDGGDGVDTVSYALSTQQVIVDLTKGEGVIASDPAFPRAKDVLISIENVTGGSDSDELIGDANANVLSGGGGIDSLQGGGGADTLNGGSGIYNFLEGGAGSDRLIGGGAFDVAGYGSSESGVRVSLATGVGQGGDAEGDRLTGIEVLIGSEMNDTLSGGKGAEYMLGGEGNDIVVGSAGQDYMIGGEAGLLGSVSDPSDYFKGSDRLSYAASAKAVRVELFKNFGPEGPNGETNFVLARGSGGDAQGDYIAGFRDLTGSAHDDVLTGYAGVFSPFQDGGRFDGGGGNDTLQGGLWGDTFIGGSGIDTVSYSRTDMKSLVVNLSTGRGSGNYEAIGDRFLSIENVTGSAFGDNITGSSVANRLNGQVGNDVLKGGRGADDLLGGAGTDRFIYSGIADSGGLASQRDEIMDFSRAETDRINLSAIDANATKDGNQAFVFIGTKEFSAAGQLRYLDRGDDVVVAGDVNGDGTADFSLHLHNVANAAKGDFIL